MEIAYDLHSQQLYCTKYDKQQIVRIRADHERYFADETEA